MTTHRMPHRVVLASAILAASAAACSGTARGLEAYRADTGKLLDTRNPQLERCYNDALKTDATLAGTVTVQFIVEKQTGAIANARVLADKTTAPPALGDCVVRALDGLVLAPPDRNEGRATFVYEFKPNPAPAG
ncbi:MAG TPA: AgmX/PglI C-terminal domain-containing protein [Kofleriaceae bacterium]|nr:AgmX/PglI C-terminal domain-containing protein [Kofleriaceae bacterium]